MSLVDLFSALADPTRCRVVEMLHERSRPVHELAAAFDISRPAISRHLKVLKDAGLVAEEKNGRENVYSLQRAQMRPMLDWLEKHRTAKPGKKARAKAIAEVLAEAPVLPAPAPMVEPVPAGIEPVVTPVPELVVAAPAPVVPPEAPMVAEAEVEPAAVPVKRKRALKPPRPVAPPPAAPQLSFFDL